MVILEVVKSLNDKSATMVFFFKLKRKQKRGGKRGKPVAISFERFLERENTSLQICMRSNRRWSSGQEGELIYAERASRGYRICEFLTNSER